jgi:hypothetical protein
MDEKPSGRKARLITYDHRKKEKDGSDILG